MLSSLLLLSALAFDPARVAAVPLFSIEYAPPPFAVSDHGDVVFTGEFAFFGTDGGLYRAPLPLGSSVPQRIAFESTSITGLAHHDGTLYAIVDPNPHSLFRSVDNGITWTPIDAALEECGFGICSFLRASQIEVADDRLFVNAGGNVLVSGDEGATWNILFGASTTGKPMAQACYDPAFALVGRQLLIGGECPLDIAYLLTGTLRPDLLGWQEQAAPALTPFLENRNVQFIRRRGDSDVVFAGIEGALLRSDDGGASYDFVLVFSGDRVGKYPYITHILFPSTQPSVIVIAGFDKAHGGPFLSISNDDGSTWTDRSDLLPGVGNLAWSVSMLKETPDGRTVVSAEDDESGAVHVYELRELTGGRRRAVRR